MGSGIEDPENSIGLISTNVQGLEINGDLQQKGGHKGHLHRENENSNGYPFKRQKHNNYSRQEHYYDSSDCEVLHPFLSQGLAKPQMVTADILLRIRPSLNIQQIQN